MGQISVAFPSIKTGEEINEIANKIKDFRRESFEYLGIFITIITFLFGSIQLFGNNTIKLAASIVNIVSLGIVLGLFIAMLYIVLYCKRYRVSVLIWFYNIQFGRTYSF